MKLKKLKWEVVSSPQSPGDNAIGILTLNSPQDSNGLGPRMTLELDHMIDEIRRHPSVRIVIVTGAGGNFCAGQDLKQYGLEMESQPEWVKDEVRDKVRKWRTELLRNLPQPVIAKIMGWCLGGALTVTVGCDVAIASDDAKFCLPEVNFGHFPAGETTPILSNYLQAKHGLYYALSGKMMSAQEAERIGLVSKVVPSAELDKEVDEFAKVLAEKSPRALKAVKEAWYLSRNASLDIGFTLSNFISERIVREQGGRPGLEQFVQKKLRPVSGTMKLEQE